MYTVRLDGVGRARRPPVLFAHLEIWSQLAGEHRICPVGKCTLERGAWFRRQHAKTMNVQGPYGQRCLTLRQACADRVPPEAIAFSARLSTG
jgi:hypothetical protein